MLGVILFGVVAAYSIFITLNIRRVDTAREVIIYDVILILFAILAMRW